MRCIARALQSSVERRMEKDEKGFFFSVCEVDYEEPHVELMVGEEKFSFHGTALTPQATTY